jgi:hypothetical protein
MVHPWITAITRMEEPDAGMRDICAIRGEQVFGIRIIQALAAKGWA